LVTRVPPRGAQFGDMRGLWGVAHAYLQQAKIALGVVDKRPGTGTANTALVYHARRLMSLHEGDLPYAVRQAAFCGQCSCESVCRLPSWVGSGRGTGRSPAPMAAF